MVISTLGIEEIYNLAQKSKRNADKILIYILFLSCGRISEVLKLHKKDIVWTTLNGQNVVIFKDMIVLKRRDTIRRSVPVIRDDDEIKEKMFSEIKAYLELIPEDTMLLFPKLTRFNAHVRLKRQIKMHVTGFKDKENIDFETNLFLHYLRHCGVTYLVNKYPKMDILKLTNFVGWAKPDMATRYYSSSWLDLLKGME